MKALIPYALLGTLGVGGTLAGSLALPSNGHAPAAPKPIAVDTTTDGSVIVRAALEREKLPTSGGETFVRVALEGKRPLTTDSKRVPVALTLLLDRSGSMSGNKIEDAKRAAISAIESLQTGDTVALAFFDSQAEDVGFAEIGVADGRVEILKDRLRGLYATGGTNMRDGIARANVLATKIHKPGAINRMLLLSDGHPDTAEGLRDQIAALAKSGVSTTTLGLGTDYNEDLMASLADAGLGHYYFVDKPEVLAGIFAEELKSLSTIVAREALVELVPEQGVEVLDVIGFDERFENGHTLIPAGDVYGGRTTDILVRVRVSPHTGSHELVKTWVSYSDVVRQKRVQERRTLAAVFVADERESLASLVPDVAIKAEKWRTSESYARANEAYNRGDTKNGDSILREQQQRLVTQSAALGSDELKEEAKQVESFQKDNASGGIGARSSLSKAAKKKAWSLNKGTGY